MGINYERIKEFVKFFVIWYSQQFAIPFWIVGHIHLSLNDYKDIYEYLASTIMHITVAIGFWLDWKNNKKDER